jgi:hypothetical protein
MDTAAGRLFTAENDALRSEVAELRKQIAAVRPDTTLDDKTMMALRAEVAELKAQVATAKSRVLLELLRDIPRRNELPQRFGSNMVGRDVVRHRRHDRQAR